MGSKERSRLTRKDGRCLGYMEMNTVSLVFPANQRDFFPAELSSFGQKAYQQDGR